MFRRLACCFGVVSFLLLPMALAATDSPKSESPRTDALGDPLPPYALLRIGTVRLRHDVSHLAISPDGKTVLSAGHDNTIRVWDLADGKELRHWRCVEQVLPHRAFEAFAISGDGKRYASLLVGTFTIGDVSTGRPFYTDDIRFSLSYHPVLAFSANGDTLVCYADAMVHVFAGGTGKVLRSFDVLAEDDERTKTADGAQPGFGLALSADGSLLVTGGVHGHVRLWDVAEGKELRKLGGDAGNVTAVTLSKDKQFYAWGNSQGQLAIGKTSGRETRQLDANEGEWSAVKALTFSPDGKQLACGTDRGSVLIFAADSGKKLHRIDAHGNRVTSLAYTADGKTLVTGGRDGCLRVWDPSTGKEKLPTHDSHGHPTVALSPDGTRLATNHIDQALHVWDTDTGKELWSAAQRLRTRELRFSPDGCRLSAFGILMPRGLLSWTADTGQARRPAPIARGANLFHISPNGRIAPVVPSVPHTFGLLDLSTGRQLWSVKREGYSGDTPWPNGIAFTPDDQWVGVRWHLSDEPDQFRLFEVSNGKELLHFPLSENETPTAFTPDRTILVTAFGEFGDPASEKRGIKRRVVSTGEVLPFVGDQGCPMFVALSPDGKTLVVSDEVGPLRLWEIATGRSRGVLQGHHGGVASFAFSADGKRLATGSEDTTALLWDSLTAAALAGKAAPKEPTATELDALWADLLADDAAAAYRAIAILAGCPRQSVPYLRTRVQPVPVADKRVAVLIADLDSPQFETRQKAHAELEALAEVAEVSLRAALKDSPSAEVRRHATDLLEKVKTSPYDLAGERLRTWRALEALEQCGTAEACAVLATLAKGDEAARLTAEAKLALARLRDRGAPVPHPD